MTLATLLALGRVSNLPTVWTNVLAASVLAGAGTSPAATISVAVALSLFYCGGMFLNDAFDRETDAVERPSRPIPSGRASAQSVFVLGGLQLVLGAAALLVATRASGAPIWRVLAVAGLLASAIVAYDASHRANPIAPWLMGACRALVYVATASALTVTPQWSGVLLAAFALAVYTAGLSYVAAVEASGLASKSWPLALMLVAPLALLWHGGIVAGLWPALMVVAWSVYALARAFRRSAPDVPGGIVRAIAGMCLLDAAWTWLAGAPALAAFCVLGVPLTRFAQRRVAGT